MVIGKAYSKPVLLGVVIAAVSVPTSALLSVPDWRTVSADQSALWNGLIAFTLLGILCGTSFLRISFANVNSSVAFVPFLASVTLFEHPWPMVISGVTAVVVDTLVRRKPL